MSEPKLITGMNEVTIFEDHRGGFTELWNSTKSPFSSLYFIQQNVSLNKKNVFRGLHYQEEYPQGKMVYVMRGRVIDFIIDLRKWSPNYKKVQMYELSEDKLNYLWVPQHFAHAFLSLEDNTAFCYNVFDNIRYPEDERCVSFLTVPEIVNEVVKHVLLEDIIITDKDRNGLHIDEAPDYD